MSTSPNPGQPALSTLGFRDPLCSFSDWELPHGLRSPWTHSESVPLLLDHAASSCSIPESPAQITPSFFQSLCVQPPGRSSNGQTKPQLSTHLGPQDLRGSWWARFERASWVSTHTYTDSLVSVRENGGETHRPFSIFTLTLGPTSIRREPALMLGQPGLSWANRNTWFLLQKWQLQATCPGRSHPINQCTVLPTI